MPKIIVILSDIRSCHNVGSILRTADGFGVKETYICGYTPYPRMSADKRLPHLSEKITKDIHKTALGAELTMFISLFDNAEQAIFKAKKGGYTVAALEQAPISTPLNSYLPANNIALVLGNEVEGLPERVLSLCDVTLEIPMLGQKESLNVSISAAIALYALKYNYSQ